MVITLCGSTKFKEHFELVTGELSIRGHIVLGVGLYGHADNLFGNVITEEVKIMLDKLHKQKIDMSDAIVVLNVNGYIGESTFSELMYAHSRGKKIYVLNPVELSKLMVYGTFCFDIKFILYKTLFPELNNPEIPETKKDTKVICFEGGELTGKTTAINNVKRLLEAEGKKVYISREPGGCEVAEEIRSVLLNNRENIKGIDSKVEELLFLAARRAHLLDILKPIKDSGEYDYILLDRFIISSAVYQGYATDCAEDREYNLKRVIDLNLKYIRIDGELFLPDTFIILDIDPEIAFTRARNEVDKNRIDRKPMEYHRLVREGYQKVFKMYGDDQWINGYMLLVDANREAYDVANDILRVI